MTIEELPSLTIVIPTYNSEHVLGQCLESIARQDYPREKVETIVVDGGSRDNTLETAKRYGVSKILNNPSRTEEIGRAIGINASQNDIIGFIDQDNILDSPDWLKKIVKPFEQSEIIGSEPLFYTLRHGDPAIVRYCSLIGGDDPLYVYLGYYDRYCSFKDRWTDLPILVGDRSDYLDVKLSDWNSFPTLGANGFFVRKRFLQMVGFDPFVHTEVVRQLIKLGYGHFAKVKVGIVHLHADSVTDFLKKKLRRARRYGKASGTYDRSSFRSRAPRVLLATMLFFPLQVDAMRGYRRTPDSVWFLHWLICALTFLMYVLVLISKALSGRHLR